MARIIDVNPSIVTIGLDNGGMKEVLREECNFTPHVGDVVDIFESDDHNRIMVVKRVNYQNNYQQASQQTRGSYYQQDNYYEPRQNAYYQPAVRGKHVDKVAYILLALFLGAYGGEQFYAGKTGAGVMSILFCWTGIPEFIALFHIVKALMTPADNRGRIFIEHK